MFWDKQCVLSKKYDAWPVANNGPCYLLPSLIPQIKPYYDVAIKMLTLNRVPEVILAC